MKTIKFHKTECGVDFLLNVLPSEEIKENYLTEETFNTDFFEIAFFESGTGSVIINQRKVPVKDNSIIFISPFQKRKWELVDHGLKFKILAFQEDFLNDFFADKLFTYRLLYFYQLDYSLLMQIDNDLFDKYNEQLSEIKTELIATKADSVHIIRSLLYYLLQKLNREYAQLNNLSIDSSTNNYAFEFKRLLEVHIKEKQRISDYTDLLNISRITLNKAVKKQFNVTATNLLKQRLLFEIKNSLIHSNNTIQEIAYQLNFSEPNHLMRFFKKQTGMTASEFQDSYQNGRL
ncbi:helix-turn-helix transcriptional regulator [Zunongwangia sp. SCSIO 43204]|uniref:helix-turn-helix domain-containing protein n=1 Tax=Zunongwangia sp. SCSIO 43204 TaxID=2779359 RepID=UPI001CA7E5FE|nr:AraC family transcriptional regulator [Zunongwangia sp. SCSIO 43204]UAB82941.1 helix-turn-helix transcriptional regulator [Zunongwangia sp. SCSIO 43204]